MHKKSFILLFVVLFILCVFSGFVFANNDIKNGVSNVTNTVIDGAERLGSDVRNGIGNAENGIEDALRLDGNTNTNNDANTNNTNNAGISDTNNQSPDTLTGAGVPGDYTAARTTTDAGLTTNNTSNLWIWIVIAIAAIVIIGLVWYYGAQNNNNTHSDE